MAASLVIVAMPISSIAIILTAVRKPAAPRRRFRIRR
jgi:hypothetical protein